MTASAFSARERNLTLAAVMVVFLLSALDQTIVSTALPRIIESLHGLELYSWVGTAYMLSSTVMLPIYGKLGDLYGRRLILLFGLIVFLGGSMLCGLSGEFGPLPILGGGMSQLVVFRAVQGIGGAALFSSSFAVIADLFPPRERARFMGLFGGVWGLASIIGPAVGGFFTDFATVTIAGYEVAGWRWVFYVNLPLGLLSLAFIVFKMPHIPRAVSGRIDYLGAALVIATFVPLLLALSWAGHAYPWGSPVIVSLLTGSAASLVLFLFVEARTRDAIVPLELFRIPAFSITNLASFIIGMAFFGVVMFMPLFMQVVQGVSATKSGFAMLPLMGGMVSGSVLSGNLVSRIGRYRLFLIGGGVILLAGVIALSRVGPETTLLDLAWRIALVGLGLGPAQGIYSLVVQNSVDARHMGVATSASQFFRQIGSTIGMAIFGTLLTYHLTVELPRHVPDTLLISPPKIDLAEAQIRAMNPGYARDEVAAAVDRRFALVARAYRGDRAAAEAVLNDAFLPQGIKEAVRDLPAAEPLPPVEVEARLTSIRADLDTLALAYAVEVEEGTKQGFAAAITALFDVAIVIIVAGFLVTLFIPEIPLRGRAAADERLDGNTA